MGRMEVDQTGKWWHDRGATYRPMAGKELSGNVVRVSKRSSVKGRWKSIKIWF